MMRTKTDMNPTLCESALYELPRYFPGQTLGAGDLALEQDYFRNKLRRHNRLLHGWGVVCGARVCPTKGADGEPDPWKVVIKPGYILGPYGDEIMLDRAICFDLRTRCEAGVTGETCVERADPWCGDVYVRPERSPNVWVAVRYKESLSRPVRAQPMGCGCDDTACEYSRRRDGYEICTLDHCPESHHNPPDPDELMDTLGHVQDCPSCPDEPWVVLAKVTLDDDGAILEIDNCSCRRIVLSFADFWLHCVRMEPDRDATVEATPGSDVELTITGARLPREVVAVSRNPSIRVVETTWKDAQTVTVRLAVAAEAEPGEYPLVLRSRSGDVVTLPKAVTVKSGRTRPTGARKKASRTEPRV